MHSVPQTNSPPRSRFPRTSSASRIRCVDTFYRPLRIVVFPSSDPFACSPLPSSGSRGRHNFRGPAVPHLHRYYGFIRSLPTRCPRSLVALDRKLPPQCCQRRLRGVPKFLENPYESVPRARDSGGSGQPCDGGYPNTAFDRFKCLGIRNDINFGAESSRPTVSLSTLLFRRSPAGRQDSLPACPLRL